MAGTARQQKRPNAEEALKGTKRPLGRSAAPTESPLHAPRACPTLRDSLSPHAGIGGNAWGTAPSSKRRPNVGRLQYYETRHRNHTPIRPKFGGIDPTIPHELCLRRSHHCTGGSSARRCHSIFEPADANTQRREVPMVERGRSKVCSPCSAARLRGPPARGPACAGSRHS